VVRGKGYYIYPIDGGGRSFPIFFVLSSLR